MSESKKSLHTIEVNGSRCDSVEKSTLSHDASIPMHVDAMYDLQTSRVIVAFVGHEFPYDVASMIISSNKSDNTTHNVSIPFVVPANPGKVGVNFSYIVGAVDSKDCSNDMFLCFYDKDKNEVPVYRCDISSVSQKENMDVIAFHVHGGWPVAGKFRIRIIIKSPDHWL